MNNIPDHSIPNNSLNGDLYDYIAGYLTAGYAPIPVTFKSKHPIGKGWQNLRISLEEVPRRFPPPSNVGILLGDPSNGLIDIDLDCPEALALATRFLPATTTFGRPSSPKSHWLYHCPQVTTRQYQFNNTMLLEVRSTGAQTVFPPSIHESGEPITFDGEPITFDDALPITTISQSALNERIGRLAAATLLTRAWGKAPGIRHSTALALAGGLMHAGFSEKKTARLVSSIVIAAGDDDYSDRLKAVITTYKAKDDKNTTGWPKLAELLGEDVVRTVREWLGIQDDQDIFGDARSNVIPANNDTPTQPEAFCFIRVVGVTRKSISWLWPNRIALGKVALIQGDPGLGKSLIALLIAAHVSTGRPWPVENTLCTTGNVLILAGEDDLADTMAPRLDALEADTSRIYAIPQTVTIAHNKQGKQIVRAIDLDKDIATIAARANELGNCRLCIVDPISEYLGEVDSNNNAAVRGLLRRVRDMAGDLNMAVILINHLNKHGKDAISKGMGSMAFLAHSRSAFHVCRDPQDPLRMRRFMLPIKSNLGKDITGFAFSIVGEEGAPPTIKWEPHLINIDVNDVIGFQPDKEKDEARQDAREFLRDLLKDGPVVSTEIKKAATACGHAWRTVERAKTELGITTRQEHKNEWQWALPENTPSPPDVAV